MEPINNALGVFIVQCCSHTQLSAYIVWTPTLHVLPYLVKLVKSVSSSFFAASFYCGE